MTAILKNKFITAAVLVGAGGAGLAGGMLFFAKCELKFECMQVFRMNSNCYSSVGLDFDKYSGCGSIGVVKARNCA